MAETKTLQPPPALYDYVLYYECASKDWLKGAKKTTIKGDGSLMDLINWNSTYSYDPDDSGGKTLFGVTEKVWKSFVEKHKNKNYSSDINTMNKNGWLDVMSYYWHNYSCAGKSANYACAFALFQMAWGGFSSSNLQILLDTLRDNADIKEHVFIREGGYYPRIADATHAYSDPMIAYDYIRKAKSTYLYNISTPYKKNKKYRCGWLTRNTLSFTPYGLFVPVSVSYETANLKYESPLSMWEETAIKWAQESKGGYVKIMDWGATPESIENITNSSYDYVSATNAYEPNTGTSFGGAYCGCNGVYQLGNYTNSGSVSLMGAQERQKTFGRGDVLNTLVEGACVKDIKTCSELTTTDKKKGVK
jgi:hypothetical protein